MKRITVLSFILMIGAVIFQANAQERGLNVLLDELQALSDSPLSIDEVIKHNFSQDEQLVLWNHLDGLSSSSNVEPFQTDGGSFFHVLNVRGSADDFGTMTLMPPYSINTIAAPLGITCFADDFDENGVLYALEFENDAGGNPLSRDLVSIDTGSGAVTVIGDLLIDMAGDTPTGLAYDFTTSTMYATSGDNLYEIDLVAGSATLIGPMGTNISIWLVIDNDGNAYAADIGDDNFFSVDLTTGLATLIGPLGIDIGFAQDAAVDPLDNTIYMAAYTGGGTGGIHTVDPATGTATLVGDTGPLDAEFGMCSIDGVPPLGVDDFNLSIVSIYPNPASDVINIETNTPGEMEIAIFDVLGKQVLNTTTSNNEISVSALNSGVYMVQVTQEGNTAVKKLVVK